MVANGPQCEDGYTRFSNELLEKILSAGLSKRELLIILAVARKTYGWKKKTDRMSHSQLAKLTGLARRHVSETVKNLVEKGVLTKTVTPRTQTLGINKLFKPIVTKTVPMTKTVTCVNQNGNNELHRNSHPQKKERKLTKEKEKIQKKIAPRGTRLTIEFVLSEHWIAWTRNKCPGLTPATVAEEFRDYWIAQPGQRGTKLDWFATWRNWCRRQQRGYTK